MGNLNTIGVQVEQGSVRSCDECGDYVPFDNPDADHRICDKCLTEISRKMYEIKGE